MIWEIDDGKPVIEGLDAHGRPDPAYAAALGLVPAPLGRRTLAALVEWSFAGILLLPALLVVVPAVVDVAVGGSDAAALFARDDLVWIIVAYIVSSVLMTAYIVVQLILHGRKGVTIGKAIFGIRSVNVRTLERPKFWRGAVVRYLVAYASFLVPLIGPVLVIALSPLFDPENRRRGWLDMVAGTWFVDIRHGLNPYDRKRMRIARKMQKAELHQERVPLPSLATPTGRDAPAEYVPGARMSGGVLGVHRTASSAAPGPATSSGTGTGAPVGPALRAVPEPVEGPAGAATAAAPAPSGMIQDVPRRCAAECRMPVLLLPPSRALRQAQGPHPCLPFLTLRDRSKGTQPRRRSPRRRRAPPASDSSSSSTRGSASTSAVSH
ncbi:RDD family protein [Microbacterium sp. NIBRBAC000506063]|uniref:RDD family protein n=1 Tax=Microbacterium sp. NIBRBAC000506063 TaxID=2734618 RepID=UPI001BB62B9D|nr:RDD family protein [Microbacterium sp. NIBRBAC000506063]QTV80224.1 RDD family protein [Microbacterium sp. NIBRBAC000506063]